jgi:hypothetical protein
MEETETGSPNLWPEEYEAPPLEPLGSVWARTQAGTTGSSDGMAGGRSG